MLLTVASFGVSEKAKEKLAAAKAKYLSIPELLEKNPTGCKRKDNSVRKMQTTMKSPVTLVNAEGLILGRMCSKVAKRLLNGEEVIILNAEKAVIFRKKKSKILEAHIFLEVGAPERGPFHYRRPDTYPAKNRAGYGSV